MFKALRQRPADALMDGEGKFGGETVAEADISSPAEPDVPSPDGVLLVKPWVSIDVGAKEIDVEV